ncbi:MAG: hypothetical protein KH703_01825 [Campylobacter gracilis]|uniref:hypothetical protein n=1 Tax=Campylobacter gracilis TaxID=824 RepID=UPI0026EF05A9|nr:hypothetical protein [Campylobacter gracilis]MBS6152144.1 hypothetical protein [Campylobacter gracilis]
MAAYFSQRCCGAPCDKTQANQRVILKFSAWLGYCAAFEILNLCDAVELASRPSPLNFKNFKILKNSEFLKF